MKKLFFIATLLMAILVSASCSKSSGNEPESKDEYYVKYEAKNNTKHIGDVSDVIVKTHEGTQTLISNRTFSETYGPVNLGFAASITCNSRVSDATAISVSIYVSKNGGPFALRANATGAKTATVSYTIDF